MSFFNLPGPLFPGPFGPPAPNPIRGGGPEGGPLQLDPPKFGGPLKLPCGPPLGGGPLNMGPPLPPLNGGGGPPGPKPLPLNLGWSPLGGGPDQPLGGPLLKSLFSNYV